MKFDPYKIRETKNGFWTLTMSSFQFGRSLYGPEVYNDERHSPDYEEITGLVSTKTSSLPSRHLTGESVNRKHLPLYRTSYFDDEVGTRHEYHIN